jgi:SAM-dependent methyltransferase
MEQATPATPNSGSAIAPQFDENLLAMAAEAYGLADRLCDHCRNFYALWGYRRLARMCGAEGGLDAIERALAGPIASGAKRILIAAAADTNLLATVARAGAGPDTEIVVIDRCRTPLELCRQFARRWSLSVKTQVVDLMDLDLTGFDLAYANSVLWYIPAEKRVDVLGRLRRALRPGGHFVHVFNTSRRVVGEAMSEYRNGYPDWVIAELDRERIQLPAPRDVFRQRLSDHAQVFASRREGTFDGPDTIDALASAAGFIMRNREELDLPLAGPLRDYSARLSKRRFMTVFQSPAT